MQHALITPQSESEQLATLAAGAMDTASRQQTHNLGTVTVPNLDGTKLIAGKGAGPSGIAPWVGDTTPPGRPTGVSAESGAGLVLVAWDGSLDGGVPPDFDHVQILVDGKDAGRLTAKGTLACGPYEPGTEHTVSAVAWDDAHAEDGSPAPNASPACTPIRVTVTGADIDPERLGITVTKSDKDPQGKGGHTGDLWLRYDQDAEGRNVLRNPGFETGDRSGWSADWSAQVIGGSVHGGRYCVSDIPKSQAWSELRSDDTITVRDGDTVIMRAWVGDYKLPHNGFYLTYKPSETGETYTGWDSYCVFTDDTGKWMPYERRYTHHGATQHWHLAITTWQEDNPSGWFNIDDVEYRVLTRGALSGEWWWDGSKWVQIPIAVYLDQLAARDVQVDSAVIGMLAAGIIKSGTFVTADGLAGFDSGGFWIKDGKGEYIFNASRDGVQMTGVLRTADTSSARFELSQKRMHTPEGADIDMGALHFYPARDPSRPMGGITGYDMNNRSYLILGPLLESTDDDMGRVAVGSSHPDGQSAKSMVDVYGDDIVFTSPRDFSTSISIRAGTGPDRPSGVIGITAPHVTVQGISADFADYDPSAWLGWSDSFEDYQGATRLYKRAGVFFLELAIKIRWGMIPSMQTIPVVRLAESIMPDHSLDVLAYGTSYAVGRVHVFGPGESQPQGTISIGTKDTTANFFQAEMFWPDPRKA